MNVEEALQIGELSEGTVVAGSNGISRKVLSIEVMEVPEVVSWVTKGILVMTAFYSIKEHPLKQVEIVKTLIDKGAAGIVIKLGRFIDDLPDEMITIANENSFPIITIPKHISYINVLMPLYEKLYDEKKLDKVISESLFNVFLETDFPSVLDGIEKLAEIVNSPVYIEDSEGRLLYVSEKFQSDSWRKSALLFSKPSYPMYSEVLVDWLIDLLTESHRVYKMQGFRDRIVLPLISRSNVFAIVHIPYVDENKFKAVSDNLLMGIRNKIIEMIMREQLYLQKARIEDMELFEYQLSDQEQLGKKEVMTLVYFKSSWMGISSDPTFYLIDYSCLVRNRITHMLTQFKNYKSLTFERYHKFYVVIYSLEDDYSKVVNEWSTIISEHNQKYTDSNLRVSISPPMRSLNFFEEKIRSVTKTMEVGTKVRPEENVYTHDKLGIYEILFNLTADPFVKNYTETVLYPIVANDKELMETLKIFLNENGNISRASERLFIHRRTLTYRLEKIQQLLNISLDNAETRFLLQFCINIKELS